jgi:hypothetical protein
MSGWVSARDPVVGDDDRMFCIVNDGTKVPCLDKNGNPLWVHVPPLDRKAIYISLSCDNRLFVVMNVMGQNNGIRVLDAGDGKHLITVVGGGIRGNIVHGTNGYYSWVQTRPPGGGTCCDDFFISNDHEHQLAWSLNTPGVTQDGAYPVVDAHNDMFVQGPNGMYQVMF